jgi:hypothetical protein
VPNIVEYNHRVTRKVKLYRTDVDDRTMLRISDTYGIRTSSRIQSELRSKRSYVVRSTRIKEPAGGILRCKQDFCFGRALHIEDVRIILRVSPIVLRKVVEDEPQKFTSLLRLPLCVNFPFFALRAWHSVLTCSGFCNNCTLSCLSAPDRCMISGGNHRGYGLGGKRILTS